MYLTPLNPWQLVESAKPGESLGNLVVALALRASPGQLWRPKVSVMVPMPAAGEPVPAQFTVVFLAHRLGIDEQGHDPMVKVVNPRPDTRWQTGQKSKGVDPQLGEGTI